MRLLNLLVALLTKSSSLEDLSAAFSRPQPSELGLRAVKFGWLPEYNSLLIIFNLIKIITQTCGYP